MSGLRALHLIDDFGVGGAQTLLPVLGAHLRRSGVSPSFAALFEHDGNPVYNALRREQFQPAILGCQGMGEATFRAVSHLLATVRPEVLHTHLEYASVLGLLAASRRRIPAVVTLHQAGWVDWRTPRAAAREMVFRLIVGAFADLAIAVSQAVADYYTGRGIPRRKLRVLHNAIDTGHFKVEPTPTILAALRDELRLAPGARVLACVARLSPAKGHDVLLQAMRGVVAQCPEAVLLVVGDGKERARLVRLTSTLGIESAVRFLGRRNDVAVLLHLAEVFVLASSYGEGIPTVIMEAAAAGLPIVSTRSTGVTELVNDGDEALLVPPGNSEALAAAILRLMADVSLRRRLGARAVKRAEGYDPARWADHLVAIYQEVAGR